MCGRATLRIVLSTPCMMFASMIEIVIMPRLGTGANVAPLTADAPRAPSSREAAPHPLAAFYRARARPQERGERAFRAVLWRIQLVLSAGPQMLQAVYCPAHSSRPRRL